MGSPTSNSMDPSLVSYGPSISKQLLSPYSSFSSGQSFPPAPETESPTRAADLWTIPAPFDQFFRGAELGKALLMLSGASIGAFIGLVAFHQGAFPKQAVRAPVMLLLMIGFFSLLSGLLFQETCPEFAVVAVVVVGAPCVTAAFLVAVADILPPNLDPFVWVMAALMGAWFLFLLFIILRRSFKRVHR